MFGARIRAIRAGTLIDGTGQPAVHDGLLVLNERGGVHFAGRASDPSAPDLSDLSADQIVVVPSGTVLPGFIDSHVHLTFGAPERTAFGVDGSAPSGKAPLEVLVEHIRADDEASRTARALHAAQAALAAGVTTLRDCGAAGRATHALRDLIAHGTIAGPRVLVCGTPVTTRGGHCWWLGGEADSQDETLALVRTLIRDGADFVKVMATGGGMTPGSNRVRAQYPMEVLAAIVEDAHRLDRRVSAHVHGLEGIQRAVCAGVDMLEHCSWETVDGLYLDTAVAERMAEAGTVVGDTIIGTVSSFAKRDAPFAALPRASQQRFEIFRRLRTLGVRVVTSSDAMYPVTPFEDFPWAVVASATYGGLTVEAAVHAATGLAAEALGLAAATGTLTPGKRADVLVVDGDMIADVRQLAQPLWVLRDGVVVAGRQTVWNPGMY